MRGFANYVIELVAPDGLSRRCLRFYLWDNAVLLDEDSDETRATTRHKFKTRQVWRRLDDRNNTMSRREVSAELIEQAVAWYRDQIQFDSD
jgi:hypothetical protein